MHPPAPCGAGPNEGEMGSVYDHFNPPAPCGAGRAAPSTRTGSQTNFNPPAPCGAGLHQITEHIVTHVFQSTRPMRGGTRMRPGTWPALPGFQSTRPMRGGTWFCHRLSTDHGYFNPPAPCGAGPPWFCYLVTNSSHFNPPAPCGAGRANFESAAGKGRFQSTRPVRGGTFFYRRAILVDHISIHPPRAGRDGLQPGFEIRCNPFQSTRPVRGGTQTLGNLPYTHALFQSTRPVRGGTGPLQPGGHGPDISIHPPRAGRDGY